MDADKTSPDYSTLDYTRMALVPGNVYPFDQNSKLATFAYPGYDVRVESHTIGQVFQDRDGWHYIAPHGAFGTRNTRKAAIALLVHFAQRNYK
jgi:hypothetical protein